MQEEQNEETKIQISFESQKQKLIKKCPDQKEWTMRTTLCEFHKWTLPDHKIDNVSIRVKLEFRSEQEMAKMKAALMVHYSNRSPYIQAYSEIFVNAKEPKMLAIQATTYRYTLAEVFTFCRDGVVLPVSTFAFIQASLIQIYKYLLYLLKKNKGIQQMRYDISPQNIALDRDYRLILLYPCLSLSHQLSSPFASRETLNNSLRYSIADTLHKTRQFMNRARPDKDEDRGLFAYIATQNQKKEHGIANEAKIFHPWSLMDDINISNEFFHFLKKKVEPLMVTNLQRARKLESLPLIKHFSEEEGRVIRQLNTSID